jgi:protocadherin delta 1
MQQYPHSALLFIFLHLITIQQKITAASNARVSLTVNIMENAPAGLILADLRRDVDILSRYNTHVLSKLTFTFLSQKHNQLAFFSLDSRTGVLTLAKPIDRDAMCPHAVDCVIVLTVALQPVQFFLVISVTVRVVDINDNTPTFTKSREILALSESTALGFIFPLPQARDIDSPAFGVTRYELRSDSRYFALNVRNASTTTVAGKLMELDLQLLESLDFEEISFFRLLVVAYDGGNPAKTGHLLVEISVLDENDNSPKFEESVYEVTVVENRAYDSAVVNVRATDEDSGQNGLVTYAFSVLTDDSYSTYFQINRDSGNIYVVQPLDYEKHSFFVLHVIARDQGESAAASALCKVVIHVVDVNDNPPVIAVNPHHPDGVTVIEEQLPIGSFIAHMSVTDADSHKGDGVLLCNYTADDGLTLLRMHGHEYKLVTSEVGCCIKQL